jgi:dienelactone hydrolase
MRVTTCVTFFLLVLAGFFFLGTGIGNCEDVTEPVPCYGYENKNYSEIRVIGHSQGNHKLDCAVIRPWKRSPAGLEYPVIAWANGWDWGNVLGQHTTKGYKLGLIEWALDGPYIVVAANQWSVQESDVLACVQWVIDQNNIPGGEYEGVVNTAKIGLAGHSQGGGAVIKAGDGEPYEDLEIAAVVAMNPYGPAWVNPENQDGPLMLLGGTADTTTPTSSFLEVFYAVTESQGGLLAELDGGTHNSEAWGSTFDENGEETTMGWEDAQKVNFGLYQAVTELWWQFHLNDNSRSGRQLKRLLDRDPWDTEYAFTDDFEL